MSGQQRVSGLDGLRGLAVALVVLFHVFPGTLPGGFLGVDVFFVLSGYLITGLLLDAFAPGTSSRAALRAFWLGRVRRLLPELVTVLAAVCVVASCAAPEFSAGLRAQVAAASVSGTNWLLIVHDQDYFAAFSADAGHPAAPALQHLWSLAVEEQFYLVWPLVLWGLLRVRRSRGGHHVGPSLLMLAAAGASFTLMAVHAGTGSSDYYNTLTHCGGLLLGAAAALRLPLRRLRALARTSDPSVPRHRLASLVRLPDQPTDRTDPDGSSARATARKLALLGRCGVGGVIVLVVLAVCLRGDTTAPERGGILLASAATLPVLLAAAVRGTDVARMLTWRPAVYLGVRSYGIYLWHWPLIVLLGAPASVDGLGGRLMRGIVELALPVLLAALSRRYVTLPARRLSRARLGAARNRLLGRAARPWAPRVLTGLAAAVLLPALVGLNRAPRADPDQAALRAQIAAGSAVAAGAPDADTGGGAAGLARAMIAIPRSAQLPPSGSPDPVLGHEITAIGDSVLLASAQALAERLPGIVIDAEVGRQAAEAPERLSLLEAQGRLRHYVIMALGTNGELPGGLLDDVRRRIGPSRVLVLVTVHMPRSWQDAVNKQVTSYAAAHPGTVLIDWNSTVAPYPDLLWPDATHPRPSGADVYADLVAWDLERASETSASETSAAETSASETSAAETSGRSTSTATAKR